MGIAFFVSTIHILFDSKATNICDSYFDQFLFLKNNRNKKCSVVMTRFINH